MGRSSKAIKNITTGVVNKLGIMLLAFATRTLFIRFLGAEYTGISSLFTNILSVLSLAELGIGNVLMFYLYSALNKNDENEICNLVQEFKRIYNYIIIAILTMGVILIPFLKIIITSSLPTLHLIGYYLLYLLHSVSSYFVIYRTMVLSADQNSYIQNTCSTVTTVVMYALQLIYLYMFSDFIGYLVIQILCTFLNNIILDYITKKKYPYLKRKIEKNEISSPIDKPDLFKNIKATFLFKVSDKILDQTGSIIMSIMFGTICVGLYSNYYMIITYIVNFAAIIVSGLVAGFGNLVAEGNKQKVYDMCKISMFIFLVIGIYCTSCYACLVQDFIPIWVGEQYLMSFDVVIAILMVFYIRMVTNTVWMFRSAMGIFKEVQYINVIAAVLNIILGFVLGKLIGVSGIIAAAAIARLITSFWYEGKVVYQKMGVPWSKYIIQQIKDFSCMIVLVVSSYFCCQMLSIDGIYGICIKLLICTFIVFFGLVVFYRKTDEFKFVYNKMITMLFVSKRAKKEL